MIDGATFVAEQRLKWRESEFQAAIINAYVGTKNNWIPHAWKAYHSFFSDRSEAGFPDMVLVRERVVFVELKTMKGRVSPKQLEWHEALIAGGAEAYIWRPADWNSGEIERLLR